MAKKPIIELSKAQRHIIYKAMYKRALKDPKVDYGLCTLLSNVVMYDIDWRLPRGFTTSFYLGMRIYNLPELTKYEPKRTKSNYWTSCTYKGWEKRLKWLVKAMEETS